MTTSFLALTIINKLLYKVTMNALCIMQIQSLTFQTRAANTALFLSQLQLAYSFLLSNF